GCTPARRNHVAVESLLVGDSLGIGGALGRIGGISRAHALHWACIDGHLLCDDRRHHGLHQPRRATSSRSRNWQASSCNLWPHRRYGDYGGFLAVIYVTAYRSSLLSRRVF